MKLLLSALILLMGSMVSYATDENISLRQKSDNGLEGWTIATVQNTRGEWVNSKLVIAVSPNHKVILTSSDPFIEKWGFADNGKNVVVRSRFAHGPSLIQKFEIASGKVIAECKGSDYLKDTPEWARPWCDEYREPAEQDAAANP